MEFRPIIDRFFTPKKPAFPFWYYSDYRVERGVNHGPMGWVARTADGWLDGIFDGRMLDGIVDGIFDGRNKKRYISLAMLLAFLVCAGQESRNEIISDLSLAMFLAHVLMLFVQRKNSVLFMGWRQFADSLYIYTWGMLPDSNRNGAYTTCSPEK